MTGTAPRPFAVFDIDGTLIRWQLYHAVADRLARHGHFTPEEYQGVKAARMIWKKREHANSFKDYEQALIRSVDHVITRLTPQDLAAACQEVLDEYKEQVYIYTRDLVRSLKAKSYLLFAISASQIEIIGMLAEHYGFDDFGGSIHEVKDGYFTGKKEVLKRERKPEYLKALVKKHNATFEGSIGVGDSESDIPVLSLTERPIAFNPDQGLYEHAHACAWEVVVERKNVIYELKPYDGHYILA